MEKFRYLRADEVDARVGTCNQNGFSLLAYKDARCDQNILDEAIGTTNWQRRHYEVKGNMFCSVGIYDKEKQEWIWKDDCGTESNTEKEKGEASDSFKRACFNWGIGRELYTVPFIYIKGNTVQNSKGQWIPTYKSFTVKEMEVESGKITKLQILGYTKENGDEVIYEYGMKSKQKESKTLQTISYEEACKYQTKSRKTFDTLSNEELLEIIYSNVKDEYKFAAKAVLDYRDMQPPPESESSLPF